MIGAGPLDLLLLRVLEPVVLIMPVAPLSTMGNVASGVGPKLSSETVVEVLVISNLVAVWGVVLEGVSSIGLGVRPSIECSGPLDMVSILTKFQQLHRVLRWMDLLSEA